MTEIDVRFDRVAEANLSSLVGKTLLSYEHTPFVFTNSVSQFVRFSVSGELWYLYCFTEPLDYYGSIEDVSVLSFESKEYSFFQDKQCIETGGDGDAVDVEGVAGGVDVGVRGVGIVEGGEIGVSGQNEGRSGVEFEGDGLGGGRGVDGAAEEAGV